MNIERSHRKFLIRQQQYEKRYQGQIYRYLAGVNADVARQLDNGVEVPTIDTNGIQEILIRLYRYVSLREAKIQYQEFGLPLEKSRQKNAITDIAGIMANASNNLIALWRGLLEEYIMVVIGDHIREINETTVNKIRRIIEMGSNEGWGASKTATEIRKQTDYNRNRSLSIARTETVRASNQGKYMAAVSSPYQMEKNWIPTLDARTRPSHIAMADNPWIDLEAFFFLANSKGVLEQALYPCDETLSASNTINCRCSNGYRVKRDSQGNILRK